MRLPRCVLGGESYPTLWPIMYSHQGPLQVTQCENLRLLASRAEIIDEMEAALSFLKPWEASSRLRSKWHPRFLYILRLNQVATEGGWWLVGY